MSGKREHEDGQRDGRSIPIHIRFVPKDVWIRLHIDTRSTIGAVKDTVLERLKVPPYDPTVMSDFYEEARHAMIKPAYQTADAKAFPKAFMARAPKRNVAEITESESKKIIGKELWDPIGPTMQSRKMIGKDLWDPLSPSPSKFQARLRGREASNAANELLGGDPGEGGMGSLSYVGDITSTNTPQEGEMTRSPTTSKLLNSVRGARSPRLKASMLSLSATAREVGAQRDLLFDPTVAAGLDAYTDLSGGSGEIYTPQEVYPPATRKEPKTSVGKSIRLSSTAVPQKPPIDLSYDPTVDAGLDAYADYLGDIPVVLLPGNADAKRREEAARVLLDEMDSSPPTSHIVDKVDTTPPTSLVLEKIMNASPKRSRFTTHSTASVSSSIHEASLTNHLEGQREGTDLELDDSTDDDESVHSNGKEAASKSVLSSGSDSSHMSLINRSQFHMSRFKKLGQAKVASLLGASVSMTDINSLALNKSALEKSRTGIFIAGPDTQVSRSSAQMMRIHSDMSTRSLTHSLHLRGDTSSNSSLSQSRDQAGHSSEGTKASEKGAAAEESGAMSKSGSGNSRIAGIQLDEISSWKDAQHALSKFFCVYSYSNGHTLEDWRTVAAFRLRPFELLEIQYSSPSERVHLPRRGGSGGGGIRLEQTYSSVLAHRPSTGSLGEMEGLDLYSAPCCEGWCYIFKRNSAANKAQRAGLGVWKLRYITIRGPRFMVYRRKPIKSSSSNEAQNTLTWNTDAIKCVFSERADGSTRPALMPLQGLSSDIVTVVFSAEASPPAFVSNEMSGWVSMPNVSLSMRFVSQMDTCAFFNAFARATMLNMQSGDRRLSRNGIGGNEYRKKVVIRATIAGRGGSVLPGRAGREGGRNALARIRLRPTDVSRQYDDVDRWSSCSEEEGNDKVISSKAFKYTDLRRSESGKDAFFDPSYRLEAAHKRASFHSQEISSPRGPMASLTPDGLLASGMVSASRLTPSARSSVDASSRAVRPRGFSFAKAARTALSPSDSSLQSSQHNLATAGAPVRPGPFGPSTKNTVDRKRRSTQPEPILGERSQHVDDSMEYFPPSSSSDKRASTPTRIASLANNGRHSRQDSSPSASIVGRNRSYTLATSSTSPPPSNSRRSSGVRTNSSTSSGGTLFHWPFRATRSPAAVDSKIVLTDDVAVADDRRQPHVM